ncbi:uncharacterized protein LOC118434554 [Folsomia candida]|uniref:uncharacterized protein LOC118434554 n=1 Tax=Folsomia candida TaxID=158441 RepID=UPI001604B0D3|nr:uncharacterized protein LOC118434554 [Folsomia candida]
MFSYALVTLWLLCVSKCEARRRGEYVETRSFHVPVVNEEEGPGYKARIILHHDKQQPDQAQMHFKKMYQRNWDSNDWENPPRQPQATIQGIVDKISQGLLSRKLLPHELEEKEAKINALGLEQIHNQTLARSERRRKAHLLLEHLRRQKMEEQNRKKQRAQKLRRRRVHHI